MQPKIRMFIIKLIRVLISVDFRALMIKPCLHGVTAKYAKQTCSYASILHASALRAFNEKFSNLGLSSSKTHNLRPWNLYFSVCHGYINFYSIFASDGTKSGKICTFQNEKTKDLKNTIFTTKGSSH